jgi:hypothetical protein
MKTDDYKERYKEIVAQAGDDQEIINAVYNGAIKQLAELSVMAKLEGTKKDLIVDLIILQEILEMTADVFDKTIAQVNADMLMVLEMLPIDDIQEAFELKQSGRLN